MLSSTSVSWSFCHILANYKVLGKAHHTAIKACMSTFKATMNYSLVYPVFLLPVLDIKTPRHLLVSFCHALPSQSQLPIDQQKSCLTSLPYQNLMFCCKASLPETPLMLQKQYFLSIFTVSISEGQFFLTFEVPLLLICSVH